jgi:hypothetical protein
MRTGIASRSPTRHGKVRIVFYAEREDAENPEMHLIELGLVLEIISPAPTVASTAGSCDVGLKRHARIMETNPFQPRRFAGEFWDARELPGGD